MAEYTIWPYDCEDSMLHLMDEKSVHCVVTSPPYFGLRDYGNEGQIGLEPTPQEYVDRLVRVFRAVRRVLRDDGTVWLNLGDSYARNPAKGGSGPGGKNRAYFGECYGSAQAQRQASPISSEAAPTGIKEKELIGIPWRVAFALQADGWYLRQEIIWAKPNPMPESVRDRCTKSHEQIFLLTKQPRYYFDAEAIKEPAVITDRTRGPAEHPDTKSTNGNAGLSQRPVTGSRNKRSVWTITPKPYKGAHFATFPPDLVEPCVLAGSPPACCSACGAPHVAIVERTPMVIARSDRAEAIGGKGRYQSSGTMVEPARSTVSGYVPSCECNAAPVSAIVLDPFGGSGTTAAVALKHGRNAVLCEINPDYIALAKQRIAASV